MFLTKAQFGSIACASQHVRCPGHRENAQAVHNLRLLYEAQGKVFLTKAQLGNIAGASWHVRCPGDRESTQAFHNQAVVRGRQHGDVEHQNGTFRKLG